MKYQVGDKIKIKSWNDLVEEFGVTEAGNIKSDRMYSLETEKIIRAIETDRTLTISEIIPFEGDDQHEFRVEEFNHVIGKDSIENSYREDKCPILNRWELLDL